MNEYHKIKTIFERDPETKYRYVIEGQYACPEFEYLKDCEWVWTEKIDGTNIRVIWTGNEVVFKGKTERAQIPSFLLEKLNEIFIPQIPKFIEMFSDGNIDPFEPEMSDICLYGEGYGAKIQKGGNYIFADVSFILFDIKIGRWWLRRIDVHDIAVKFGIDSVPIIGGGTLYDAVEYTKFGHMSLIAQNKEYQMEGLVLRPAVELKARNGGRIIAKIKTSDFPK